MPIFLECDCGHQMARPADAHRTHGTRCEECGAPMVRKVKALAVKAPAKAMIVRKTRSDKGGKHKPRVKPCPAAPGCPQTPDCGGCAFEPVVPRPPHPMMAMQEGQTAQEVMGPAITEDEGPRLCDLYPVDNDLDDPDSPRHMGAVT